MELAIDASELPTSITDMAVRLADEGIPVRAIARSIKASSDAIYSALREAIDAGRILAMPRDDWPAGTAREHRILSTTPILNNEEMLLAISQRAFKLTKTEAVMLALLLKRNEATKDQLHTAIEQAKPGAGGESTDKRIIDVYICKMRRKLKPYDISIDTIWGTGYLIPFAGRERAVFHLATFAYGA